MVEGGGGGEFIYFEILSLDMRMLFLSIVYDMRAGMYLCANVPLISQFIGKLIGRKLGYKVDNTENRVIK